MATLLLTGPSGVGKDYVKCGVKEKYPGINSISLDCLFDYIKETDFTPAERTSDHDCINKQYRRIDFSKRYAERIVSCGFDETRHSVVHGVQLAMPHYREPLFDVIHLDPRSSFLLAIYPSPEVVHRQCLSSKKQYHLDHADIRDCRGRLDWHKKELRKALPPFNFQVCQSKEQALKLALNFMKEYATTTEVGQTMRPLCRHREPDALPRTDAP